MNVKNIEICCSSINSIVNAKLGSAARIELCQALGEGGTTPSFGTLNYAIKELELMVFVLVRPRGGNFVYNKPEILTMEEDVEQCKKLGASGIVVGFLTKDNKVDKELTRRFVESSKPLPVTFHRAFDECPDPLQALEDVIDCGCARILTSGCKPTAIEGAATLKQLVENAGNRIKILAGSGITPENAETLIAQTNVPEIHGSCKTLMPNGAVETDLETVKKLVQVCSRLYTK